MHSHHIVLFGEAERGEYKIPYLFTRLDEMERMLGHPPHQTRGIPCGIQALLYDYPLIYFRVQEEGFSRSDYQAGVSLLLRHSLANPLVAICAPGVGSAEIIDAIAPVCGKYHSILITNSADLYDFLTETMQGIDHFFK